MTEMVVHPSLISGSVTIPASKSHSIRAIILASLASGVSRIYDYLPSKDVFSAIKACEAIGATIVQQDHHLEIHGTAGKISPKTQTIDVGNSGILLRFLGALSALGNQPIIFTGDESIQQRRVVAPLLKALRELGASAGSLKQDGHAPFEICGAASAGEAFLDGADSQPVSGILFLAAFLNGITKVHVSNPGEKPWIDLTLAWLKRIGIRYEREGYHYYKIYGKSTVAAFDYKVPGDFSSAAFMISAAIICQTQVTLYNLDMQDVQGDKALFDVLKKMGLQYTVNSQECSITILAGNLQGGEVDMDPIIDALPVLSVMGSYCRHPLKLKNAAIARKKESDRIKAIASELNKLNVKLHENEDGIEVFPSTVLGGCVDSHFDHRIAMSLAVAALKARDKVRIRNIDCISKSYPSFIEDLKQLGAQIEVL